ncbi:hypothetical protein TBLA_0F02700 [Henningerozyma blattae CBS 6284]|uniref:Uncharacterized protein n=1 Tax=Henningerozyma blattae (strain ATCC 34711 / CBS 6284 / DSM 70876 / NBRC 10599 / NRRL Y-10934 / UCD 77-7) TaxID=1071380 RepID=I2H607_HENB6|nr:hypothetical protein TBLA_0F02700 [Tetrapisispora blattae CBS 6284]CCH61809.1 hypothetical protein TBLA_0F02700 [Tetrapisispora blattae CBS 6284]
MTTIISPTRPDLIRSIANPGSLEIITTTTTAHSETSTSSTIIETTNSLLEREKIVINKSLDDYFQLSNLSRKKLVESSNINNYKKDFNLRKLVGHANMLDKIMDTIDNLNQRKNEIEDLIEIQINKTLECSSGDYDFNSTDSEDEENLLTSPINGSDNDEEDDDMNVEELVVNEESDEEYLNHHHGQPLLFTALSMGIDRQTIYSSGIRHEDHLDEENYTYARFND